MTDISQAGTDVALIEPVSQEEIDSILPPSNFDMLETFFERHEQITGRAMSIHASVTDPLSMAAMSHFFEAAKDHYNRSFPDPETVFNLPMTLKHIDAAFWMAALQATEAYDFLPQPRRDEWHKSVRELTTPEFSPMIVKETFSELYRRLPQYIAERATATFKALSRHHVTNSAYGFSQRGIFPYGYEAGYFSSFKYDAVGTLTDLINTIAIIEGDFLSTFSSTENELKSGVKEFGTGKWFPIYKERIMVRCYIKGTIHIQVDEAYAWKLNVLLALDNPNQIPQSSRRPPESKERKIIYTTNTLSKELHQVFRQLNLSKPSPFEEGFACPIPRNSNLQDKHLMSEFCGQIELIGGRVLGNLVCFDYDPTFVLNHISTTAKLLDRVSHQFYPTPADLADKIASLAKLEHGHRVLEPSAGAGAIADAIGRTQIQVQLDLIELSATNAKVLEGKGYAPVVGDFLQIAKNILKTNVRYDRILANTPYSQGRYKTHAHAASKLLKSDGKLLMFLPECCQHKQVLHGFHQKTLLPPTRFPNTSISVVLIEFTRK